MSFQNTTTVFAGVSDFRKLVLTVLKINFTKNKPNKLSIEIIKISALFCLTMR